MPSESKYNPAYLQYNASYLQINAYQEYALREAIYPQHGQGTVQSITIALSGLMGESGAALNDWNRILRGGEPLSEQARTQLGVGLAHTLWYCAALASELGMSMSNLAIQSITQAQAWRREHDLTLRQGDLHEDADELAPVPQSQR